MICRTGRGRRRHHWRDDSAASGYPQRWTGLARHRDADHSSRNTGCRGVGSTSGFSPLRSINQHRGDLAWSWSLPNGPNERPRSHDGVAFVHSYGDHVQALDAATGDLFGVFAPAAQAWRPASSASCVRHAVLRPDLGRAHRRARREDRICRLGSGVADPKPVTE